MLESICDAMAEIVPEVRARMEDLPAFRELIRRHHQWTGSVQARRILDNWQEMSNKFVKVMPIDYRKALERLRAQEAVRADQTPATEEVFRGEGLGTRD